MDKKINVALLFGGKSFEHEVSLKSAENVARALNREKYEIAYILIDKQGNWLFGEEKKPIPRFHLPQVDVVFPIFHGPYGEDGTVQGYLRLADIPFVGADVLTSSIGMDKEVTRRLARQSKIVCPPFVVLHKGETPNLENFSFPLFVKPNNGGSSIGITKVYSGSDLAAAIAEAFRYSPKILIEQGIAGREIQIAVMGDRDNLKVSLPCAIVPKGEMHTYAAKYLDHTLSEFLYPAPLTPQELHNVQTTAIAIYHALCCEGMARIDFFLRDDGILFFNEINTIPGLTDMSPYAKMWEMSGISYSEMLDFLIEHALTRYNKEKQLITEVEWSKI